MKYLLVGADKNNATDGHIVKGIVNLLNKKYSNFEYDYVLLDDHQEQQFHVMQYDKIIICGTPWLWDSFQNSVKYKHVIKLFSLYPNTEKVFCGIGTCLNEKDRDSEILRRPEEQEGMRKLFSNTKIIVRDKLTHSLLKQAGLESVLLPCPAFFAYEKGEFDGYPLLVYTDPKSIISSGDWQDEKKLNKYNNLIKDFYNKYHPNVICKDASEVLSSKTIGIHNAVQVDINSVSSYLKNANIILSGRVHCAIPALAIGKKVGLISFDTRSDAFLDWGGTIVNNISDVEKLNVVNKDWLWYNRLYDV